LKQKYEGREMKKLAVVTCCFLLIMCWAVPATQTLGQDFENPNRQETTDSDYYFEVKFIGRCWHVSGQKGICLFLYHPQKKISSGHLFSGWQAPDSSGEKTG